MPGVASNDPSALDHGLPSQLEFTDRPGRRVGRGLLDPRLCDDARDHDQCRSTGQAVPLTGGNGGAVAFNQGAGLVDITYIPDTGPARGGTAVRQGDRQGPGADQHHRGAEPDLRGDQLTRSWLMRFSDPRTTTAASQPAERGRTGDARADVDGTSASSRRRTRCESGQLASSSKNSRICSTGPTRPTPMTPIRPTLKNQIFTATWVGQYTVGEPLVFRSGQHDPCLCRLGRLQSVSQGEAQSGALPAGRSVGHAHAGKPVCQPGDGHRRPVSPRTFSSRAVRSCST